MEWCSAARRADRGRAMNGRVALVTGGGRGIGREAALLLSAGGARVMIGARTGGEQAPAVWRETMRINLDGPFELARLTVGGMCKRGFGRLVFTSSTAGEKAERS